MKDEKQSPECPVSETPFADPGLNAGDITESRRGGMKKGKMYKVHNRRFPFDCPYGIFVETTPSGFLRFVWNGKDLLMNGGEYEEVEFEAILGEV